MNKINRRLIWLALPFMLGFFMFYLLPLVGSLRYSLVESAFSQRFVGLKNYAETLANRNFRLGVKNTLELIALGVPILVLASLLLSVLLENTGERLHFLRAALLLPMLLPSSAVASVFGKLDFGNARIPVLAIFVWKNTGFLTLILLAAFSMIPKSLYEAAALDGAKKPRMLVSITLPMIAGTLLFVTLLAVSYNLRLFREAYLLYGPYPNQNMYLTQHNMNNHFYKLNYQKLTATASIFSFALLAIIWVGLKLSNSLSGGRYE